MKSFLLYLFFAYIALSAQSIFFSGIKPDLVLVLVCFYSLNHGQRNGAAYGALTGMIIDGASGFVLGPNIMSKSLAGFFVSAISSKVFQWNMFVNTLIIAVFSVIDVFLVHICLETFSDISFVNRSWNIPLIQIVLTVIAAMIMYIVLKPVNGRKEGYV